MEIEWLKAGSDWNKFLPTPAGEAHCVKLDSYTPIRFAS